MEITYKNAIEKYLSGEITCNEALHIMWPRTREVMDRIWALTALKYSVDKQIIKAWLTQWLNNPLYDDYNANEVNLLVSKNIIYLIPKETKMTKPIRLIKAQI